MCCCLASHLFLFSPESLHSVFSKKKFRQVRAWRNFLFYKIVGFNRELSRLHRGKYTPKIYKSTLHKEDRVHCF
jgi:hypothetical protein